MKSKNLIIGGLIATGGLYFFPQESNLPLPKFKEGIGLEVKLIDARVLYKNGIGNEWSFDARINDSIIIDKRGVLTDLSGREKIEIKSTATEEDPSHDDVGISTILINPDNLLDFLSKKTLVDTVEVYEHYGDGAGNTAICKFEYVIQIDSIK